MKSDKWLWENASEEMREMVAATCWRDAWFNDDGSLYCKHQELEWFWDGRLRPPPRFGHPDCREELLCEIMAAVLLIPTRSFMEYMDEGEDAQCARWQVETWVLEWRTLIHAANR